MCVFTDRKKKAIAFALVPVIAINVYAGCKMLNKTSKNMVIQPSTSIDQMIEEKLDDETYLELDDSNIEVEEVDESQLSQEGNGDIILGQVVVEETDFTRLDRVFKESRLDIDTILRNEDRSSELYVSALYSKLKTSLSEDIIRNELSNIIVYGSNATCMSEYEWQSLFGNLGSTISIFDNVVDYYYPLAKYVHLYACDLEHSSLFFDEYRITCSDIQEKYNILNPQVDIRDYFTKMVSATNDIRLIEQFNKLLDSGVDLEILLCELENVYVLSMVPTEISEGEWMCYFGNLVKTVEANENVCIYYYDLAYYIHELWCDFDHQLNEYNRYECETYKLTLEI